MQRILLEVLLFFSHAIDSELTRHTFARHLLDSSSIVRLASSLFVLLQFLMLADSTDQLRNDRRWLIDNLVEHRICSLAETRPRFGIIVDIQLRSLSFPLVGFSPLPHYLVLLVFQLLRLLKTIVHAEFVVSDRLITIAIIVIWE